MAHVLVSPERAEYLRRRLKEMLAERQAVQEKIERIDAGAPRATFGDFGPSFEEIAPDLESATEALGVRLDIGPQR